uniref:Uncharacterized protein n=1 Tax=Chromera velia CCMP2878 TaxID=1169474 RepID=A0A0G4FKK8_9ALVE|eukprot:Cvel_406.t1-p1 / transcript=Cvel_406.t1 / gene=Cvel_406 / organism=Chromera_velia_CCMP2878 / gene_product=hypothetical protein / transcript_product=hypothetical protein / location=Cvel_scaffold13:83272-90964(+) / protein_length=571 / sequence_SO=supercontig / SO=protein_coding / is_pseudo=false
MPGRKKAAESVPIRAFKIRNESPAFWNIFLVVFLKIVRLFSLRGLRVFYGGAFADMSADTEALVEEMKTFVDIRTDNHAARLLGHLSGHISAEEKEEEGTRRVSFVITHASVETSSLVEPEECCRDLVLLSMVLALLRWSHLEVVLSPAASVGNGLIVCPSVTSFFGIKKTVRMKTVRILPNWQNAGSTGRFSGSPAMRETPSGVCLRVPLIPADSPRRVCRCSRTFFLGRFSSSSAASCGSTGWRSRRGRIASCSGAVLKATGRYKTKQAATRGNTFRRVDVSLKSHVTDGSDLARISAALHFVLEKFVVPKIILPVSLPVCYMMSVGPHKDNQVAHFDFSSNDALNSPIFHFFLPLVTLLDGWAPTEFFFGNESLFSSAPENSVTMMSNHVFHRGTAHKVRAHRPMVLITVTASLQNVEVKTNDGNWEPSWPDLALEKPTTRGSRKGRALIKTHMLPSRELLAKQLREAGGEREIADVCGLSVESIYADLPSMYDPPAGRGDREDDPHPRQSARRGSSVPSASELRAVYPTRKLVLQQAQQGVSEEETTGGQTRGQKRRVEGDSFAPAF